MGLLDARGSTVLAVLSIVVVAVIGATTLPTTLSGGPERAATLGLVVSLVAFAVLAGTVRAEQGRRTPYW